jgi:hypothetical protein
VPHTGRPVKNGLLVALCLIASWGCDTPRSGGGLGNDADPTGSGGISRRHDAIEYAVASGANRAPAIFEVVNRRSETIYLDGNVPVSCAIEGAQSQALCSFFRYDCLFNCEAVKPGQSCCVMCEPAEPRAIAIAPGERYTVAWDGRLFARERGECSECECQRGRLIAPGTYRAVVRAYTATVCTFGDCVAGPDGMSIGARPSGVATEHEAELIVPTVEDRVLIEVDGS